MAKSELINCIGAITIDLAKSKGLKINRHFFEMLVGVPINLRVSGMHKLTPCKIQQNDKTE
jgi:hypothetical protein